MSNLQYYRWLSKLVKKGNHLFSILLFVFMFCLSSTHVSGKTNKTIYVTFNPGTCLNCSANLYSICELKEVEQISLIIPKMFQGDSTEMDEEYLFSKQSKLKLIFSDSLYQSKMKNENFPEIVIEDINGKELFRKVLTIVKNDEFIGVLTGTKEKKQIPTQTFCIHSITKKNIANLYKLEHYLAQDGFINDQYYLVNLKDTIAQRIKIPDSDYAVIYKTFLKDSFRLKYPIIKDIFNSTPVWKPTITGLIEYKNSIYVLIEIKDYHPQGGEDTGIYGHAVLGKWDMKRGKFIEYYTVDKTVKDKAWGPVKIYVVQSKLYGECLKKGTSDFRFFELSINEKLKTICFTQELPIYIPQLYAQLKVDEMEERNIKINGEALAFDYANNLYVFSKGKFIPIPFDKKTYTKYDERMIRDVYSDGVNHAVYYVENKHDFYLLQFNDAGKKSIISLGNKESNWVTRFYNCTNSLVLKNLETGCFEIRTFPSL